MCFLFYFYYFYFFSRNFIHPFSNSWQINIFYLFTEAKKFKGKYIAYLCLSIIGVITLISVLIYEVILCYGEWQHLFFLSIS